MISFSNSSKIMVIAAHPDDEILGCGATIHKWVQNGAEAHALILGTGLTSRDEGRKDIQVEAIESLRQNAKASADIIGYKTISVSVQALIERSIKNTWDRRICSVALD